MRTLFIDPSWPSGEQARARTLIVLALSMVIGVIPSCIASYARGEFEMVVVGVIAIVLIVTALLVLRFTRSIVISAMILLLWNDAALFLVCISEGGFRLATSSWAALFVIVSFFLVGARLGLLISGLLVAEAVVALIVHVTGNQLPLRFTDFESTMSSVMLVVGFAFAGIVAYLYAVARQRTLDQLADALQEVERDERQLTTLIENTDAEVCSLDQSGCLQVFNHAFARAACAQRGAEPRLGDRLADVVSAEQMARWRPCLDEAFAHPHTTRIEEQRIQDGEHRHRETSFYPILNERHMPIGMVVFSQDITERKHTEAEMQRLHAEHMTLSRYAGMAAVASEVMRNAGNILNSVNLSTSLMLDRLGGFEVERLNGLVELLDAHAEELDTFLRDDSRGRRLPELLRALADHFLEQEAKLGTELSSLREGVTHLTRVVHSQENLAGNISLIEEVSVEELIGAALALSSASWEALNVDVERHIGAVPTLHVDRHKLLEILVNLLGNAYHALRDSARVDKRLRIRAEPAGDERVTIEIEDNGVGIAGENRDKLFRLGFTTKEQGHGVGLHSSANTAAQLGGCLTCHSEGLGQGATFTIELPVHPPRRQGRAVTSPWLP
ncbi:ATP-binding protein [Haliangium sp.]|uniref:ATP-binding protein n=1 Tax=Haliangium sp. TaxID=2663208 RepID=UPI003D0C79B0